MTSIENVGSDTTQKKYPNNFNFIYFVVDFFIISKKTPSTFCTTQFNCDISIIKSFLAHCGWPVKVSNLVDLCRLIKGSN